MAVTTSYPGVYVQERSSGVHTITGVATSITAFLGYAPRGPVNEPVHIFNLGDYERAFGGVSFDSPMSHSVRHFYANGGSDAYVVRVAHGAKAASVKLQEATSTDEVLVLSATSEGTWGNQLRVGVDYATADPDNLFNVTISELVDQNGELGVGRSETYLNLSMDSQHPSYVVGMLNARSDLVDARSTATFTRSGTSTSGLLTANEANAITTGYRLAYTLNGEGPFEAIVTTPPTGTDLARLGSIATALQLDMSAKSPPGVTVQVVNGPTATQKRLQFTANLNPPTHMPEQSTIRLLDASKDNVATTLKLGKAHGGTELDGASDRRPMETGLVVLGGTPTTSPGSVDVEVLRGTTSLKSGIDLPLWTTTAPTTVSELAAMLNAALTTTARTEALLAGFRAVVDGTRIRVLPGPIEPELNVVFSNATAGLELSGSGVVSQNVAAYAPGRGVTVFGQVQGDAGNNGTPPDETDLSGSASGKTGIYALEDVDLFNLMVIPDASMKAGMTQVLMDAIAYCEKRRAFLIIDLPEFQDTLSKAKAWADQTAGPLRSRNSALFFPWAWMTNPLNTAVPAKYGAGGALAGVFARTDAEVGVWKAPAGLKASVAGALGLVYKLTDDENGVLNPIGINCLRTFPVIGTVNWGARTGRGADAFADEYKYIPVRRLALFLEESLYRGTQWVVFEPNDEPLWAQIRLNLGAFMHNLFAQGAFQGKSPREAYFVKCDSETTTQNDIDLGRVNIVIGFAPLKPAEFVIITVQQIAGHIQT